MIQKILCEFCEGTGQIQSPDVLSPEATTCASCQGTGCQTYITLSAGYHLAVNVLDSIDFAEYQGLNTNQAQAVALILSAGHVNLNTGSNARVKLGACFPSGVTNGNLATLIGEAL